MIFQIFSQNKHKRKKEESLMERAGGNAIGLEIRGKKPCLVLELRKKKLTFTIIEADKMDFFFPCEYPPSPGGT
jgi:hypothetical protein